MERHQFNNVQKSVRGSNGSYAADVIVVGGGLAGLAAATYLARAGRSVTLFEKASHLGGRSISQERQGFVFNLGPHALYNGSPAVQVLKELGITYTVGSPVGIRAIDDGHSFIAPVDTTTLLKTKMLSFGGKWEAARLLLKLKSAKPDDYANITLSEWLDRNAQRPEVRRVLETTARGAMYADAPDRLSMGGFIEQFQMLAKGKVLYVDGGWQTLVEGLERAAREGGVRIITGVRVEAIEHESGKVIGVRLADGTFHAAQSVVVAAAPKEVLQMLPGAEVPILRNFTQKAIPVHGACLDVALRRLPNPENKVVFSGERPLFLTVQSEFSKMAPEGGALVCALKYLNPDLPQDTEANERELEAWLDETQPGWRNEVIERRYLPNLVVSNALVTAAQGGGAGRPWPQVEGIDNLYVAGDWVGPRGILASAVLWSAKLAAGAILAGSASDGMSKAA